MTDQVTTAMRKQMLEDRITKASSALGINEDEAFMRIAYALLFNTEDDIPDYDVDVVDGSGDKQIDIVRIEEFEDQAIVNLVQVKNNSKYEGNVIVQMRDALSWIFERPDDQYQGLANESLIQKISEIREIISNLTPRNVEVVLHYVAKGNTSRLSPDFSQEIQITEDLYNGSKDFLRFGFKVWGIDELIERSYEIRQDKHRIDVDLPIYSIWNVPSYLLYGNKEIEALVCVAEGIGLAKIVEQYGERLFEENVRTYLGDRKSAKKSVNADILNTCSDDEKAEYFWFYNNGVTVTCDSFSTVYSATPPFVKISNIQIVNGCQTSMTIYEAYKKGKLSGKTKVLFKVFATKDKKFVDKITLTTNSQNAVSERDLRSNDELQRNLQELFESRGYFYERKPRMFKDHPLTKSEKKKIISNEKVGQAHIAVAQHQPAIAMAHSNKIWSDAHYQSTYGASVEELLASYLIYIYCINKSKQISKALTGIDKATVKYGNFHLARIIGSLSIGEHWGHPLSRQQLTKFIVDIEKDPDILRSKYESALSMLKDVVEDLSNKDTSKLINVFKSDKIKQKLDNVMKKTV